VALSVLTKGGKGEKKKRASSDPIGGETAVAKVSGGKGYSALGARLRTPSGNKKRQTPTYRFARGEKTKVKRNILPGVIPVRLGDEKEGSGGKKVNEDYEKLGELRHQ